jgi:hypothetical protein
VLFPAAEPENENMLETATPMAVEVQQAYVYLFLIVHEFPKAKIPRVLFPAADPPEEHALEEATPAAVDVQEEYVYLFLVVLASTQQPISVLPIAKIPRVLFPAADPLEEHALDDATPTDVDEQQAYVYLLRIVVLFPKANIPAVLFPAAAP